MPRNEATSARMRAESQTALLQAARKLFAQKGFFNCTVSEIAAEAGMSQGNVYWYFNSKEALLKAVLADGFTAIERLTADVAQLPGGPREQIEALIEQSLVLYDEQGYFMTILLSLMAHGGPAYLAELGFDMAAIGQRYHSNLLQVFDRARRQGLVADMAPDLHVMNYFGLINGLMLTYSAEWLALPPAVFRATIWRLFGGEP